MDSTTPIFGLDPAINVLDWLFALESRIRRLGVPEDENIFIAGDFTKIIAFHMAKRKMMNGNRNCENNRPWSFRVDKENPENNIFLHAKTNSNDNNHKNSRKIFIKWFIHLTSFILFHVVQLIYFQWPFAI